MTDERDPIGSGSTPLESDAPRTPPEAPEAGAGGPGGLGAPMSEADVKTWCIVGHVAAFAGFTAIPFANILGPLIVWLIKKDADPAIDYHAKEALNFNISCAIYGLACFVLAFIVIGIFMAAVLIVFWVVMVIMAALKVSNGEPWRYPLTIRLVS